MREPTICCPKCEHSYGTLGTLQRHAHKAHGLKANELNQLMEEGKENNEKVHKHKKEHSSKRTRKTAPETEGATSDVSVEKEERHPQKSIKRSSDILQQSISGLKIIGAQNLEEKEFEEVEVVTEMEPEPTPETISVPINLSADQPIEIYNTPKITKPAISKGKFITVDIPVRRSILNINRLLQYLFHRAKG